MSFEIHQPSVFPKIVDQLRKPSKGYCSLTYFAGPSRFALEFRSRVEKISSALTPIHRWWDDVISASRGEFGDNRKQFFADCIRNDLSAIAASSRLVAIMFDFRDPSAGAWLEIGYALAIGIHVYVVMVESPEVRSTSEQRLMEKFPFLHATSWTVCRMHEINEAICQMVLHREGSTNGAMESENPGICELS